VAELVAVADTTPQAAFYELAKAAARGGSLGTTYATAQDDARLADAKRKLSLVRVVSPLGHATLLDIRDLVSALLQQADANESTAACASQQQVAESSPANPPARRLRAVPRRASGPAVVGARR
jgi:hypothetical protein